MLVNTMLMMEDERRTTTATTRMPPPPGPTGSVSPTDEEQASLLQTEEVSRYAIPNGDLFDSTDKKNTTSSTSSSRPPSPSGDIVGAGNEPRTVAAAVDKEEQAKIHKNEGILAEEATAKSRGRPLKGSKPLAQQIEDLPAPSPPVPSVQESSSATTGTTARASSSTVENDRSSKRKAARRRRQQVKEGTSSTRSSGGTYRSSSGGGARSDIEEGIMHDDYSDEDDDEDSSHFPGATRVGGSKATASDDDEEDDVLIEDDEITTNHVNPDNESKKEGGVSKNDIADIPEVLLEAMLVEEDPPIRPVPTPEQLLLVSCRVMEPSALDASAKQEEELRKSFEEFLAIKAREEERFGNNWCGCTRCSWVICCVLCTCLVLLLVILMLVLGSVTIESAAPTMAPTGSPSMM